MLTSCSPTPAYEPEITPPNPQNASRNDLPARVDGSDSLAAWAEAYFRLEVTTLESSQSVQRRDLALFLTFMLQEIGSDDRAQWTPSILRN